MATNINVLVSSVLQIISDLRGESSTNTDAVRIRAVSRANKDFALRKFWKFYLMPNQSLAGSGVNDYTIGSATYPMRYKGLAELFVSDSTTQEEDERYEVLDFNIYKNQYNRNNSNQIAYEWYDKANDVWKVHINPAPEATDTIYYSYYWEPPTLTATTDYCVCPNPKVIALMASAEIHESEDERDTAKDEKNEAEQLISELQGQDNSPAQNQLYGMGALESSISPHGIGNY
jgi:hypothetical protein